MTNGHPERIRRNSDVLQRSIDTETVLYLPASDEVVVLDAIGSEVWNHVDGTVLVAELTQTLASRFDQPVERIAMDIAPLLGELLAGRWLLEA